MEKCYYCKKGKDKTYFCCKNCEDNYKTAIAITKIKTPIMDIMREISQGDKETEKLFLQSLIFCLNLDLKEREK